MFPKVVNGLPAHVLLAHFAVVATPAIAALLIAAVAIPAARDRIGIFGPILALVDIALVQVTADAGEWFKRQLEAKVGAAPAIEHHASLGDSLLFFAIGMFVLFSLWWLATATEGRRFAGRVPVISGVLSNSVVKILLGVASVGLGLATLYYVYLVGDSGAHAVWDGVLG